MQKLIAALALSGASAFVAPKAARAGVAVSETQADLEKLAVELNPIVGFWDPLSLADAEFWDTTNEQTIGFLRHAEIKHGRVAMAGFVGYCVHANGIVFPWNIQTALPQTSLTSELPTISFADISAAGGPADMWDALPTAAKLQIILVVGFLEMHGENSLALEADGQKHYVRGGKARARGAPVAQLLGLAAALGEAGD